MTEQAWSYSALTRFENCPRQYYHLNRRKDIIEPPSAQQTWGKQVHSALEHRITVQTPLPTNMVQYEGHAQRVVAVGGIVNAESKLALGRSFEPVSYFSKNPPVWVRAVTDFDILKGDKCFVGDWKTGKKTPDSQQLRLSAAMVMAAKPHVNTVISSFIWLIEPLATATSTEIITRADVPGIWAEFVPRAKRLDEACKQSDQTQTSAGFPPKPSGLCKKWCAVHTCEHNGNYRAPAPR
jgi:hypothetical protein